jgi:ABC-type transporter Mla subunit MlaD
MITDEEFINLQGKVEAIIDVMSGQQRNYADSEQLKRFIDNYAVIEGLVENDTIDTLVTNVVKVTERFNEVSARIDGLLGSVEVETDKIMSTLSEGGSSIALNVADMVLFQTSVSDAYRNILGHLNDIDITGKINRMESALAEALGLIENMRAQKNEIDILLQKIAENRALIDNMEEVNNDQTTLINTAQNMIVELEKQIENYAFYSEEFDKIYTTAVTFVSHFSDMVAEIERVSARDANLESLMSDVVSLTQQSFTTFDDLNQEIVAAIDRLGLSTAQKIDNMLLFVDEYNAVGTALHAVSDRMRTISSSVSDEIGLLSQEEAGYTA